MGSLGDGPDRILDFNARAATLRAGAEVDGDSVLDLIEQLRALELGGGTDYGQAFEVAVEFFEDQPAATNLVSFLSEGRGFGECADELALLTDPAGFDATLCWARSAMAPTGSSTSTPARRRPRSRRAARYGRSGGAPGAARAYCLRRGR